MCEIYRPCWCLWHLASEASTSKSWTWYCNHSQDCVNASLFFFLSFIFFTLGHSSWADWAIQVNYVKQTFWKCSVRMITDRNLCRIRKWHMCVSASAEAVGSTSPVAEAAVAWQCCRLHLSSMFVALILPANTVVQKCLCLSGYHRHLFHFSFVWLTYGKCGHQYYNK